MLFRIQCIIASILVALPGLTADIDKEGNAGKSAVPLFVPYSELSLAGKYYTPYRNDYHSAMDMNFFAEIFHLGSFDITFDFTGTTAFRENSDGIEPDLIFYRMNYITARWKFPIGHIGVFADHLCNNRVNINDNGQDMIRWYGAGVRWDAPGFSGSDRIYYAGKGPYLTGSVSASYAWQADRYLYNTHLSGIIRGVGPDIFILSPYLEGSVVGKIGDEKNLDIRTEAGVNAGWEEGEFSLFTGTERIRGTKGYYEEETLNHYTGIKFTSWIVDDGRGGAVPGWSDRLFRYPKIFFNGVYGKYAGESQLNFHSDIKMLLFFPAAASSGFYGSARLMHDSLRADNGMYPRYIQYSFEGGFNILPGILGMTFIPYTRFQRYDEGNTYDGSSNWFSSAGLRIVTAPYYSDSRMMMNRSLGAGSWFPLIGASCERVYKNGSFPVDWVIQLNINQWLIRGSSIGVSISGTYFKYFGDFDMSEFSVEPALFFGKKRNFALFYRYTHREKEMVENGIFTTEHLAGIRFVL
jgi:hypothetical protein